MFGKSSANRQSGGSRDNQNGTCPESKVTCGSILLVLFLSHERCIQILLLNGPPGVGKTTLVHILARQAGYRPMEINARSVRIAYIPA